MSTLFLYVQIRFLGSKHFQKKLLGPQIAGYRDFLVHLRPSMEDQKWNVGNDDRFWSNIEETTSTN